MPTLPYEVRLESDAAEKYFCKKFDKIKVHPLSDIITKYFIVCAMANDAEVKIAIDEIKKANICYGIFKERINPTFKITVEDKVIMFLAVVVGSPAETIMYGTYISYVALKHNRKNIDFNFFAEEIFPFGFPSEESMMEMWDKQKLLKPDNTILSDNLLDYDTAIFTLIHS